MTGIEDPLQVDRLRLPVAAADRDAVIALEAGSFANPWTAATFDKMLEAPVSHVYVARAGTEKIVAFCACWVIEDEVHINTVAVDGGLRGRGIATALLTEVLRRTGPRRATLEVRASNAAALRLYEKLGFKITAVRPDYYDNPQEDGLILWLNP
jgi:ribosomal-protein-alanine N-acetyltransferase